MNSFIHYMEITQSHIKFVVTHLENPSHPGKQYSCNLSLKIAHSCPTIKFALMNFSEGTKGIYTYGDENITIGAIKLFFSWKRLIVYDEEQKIDFSQITANDWKCAMYMAVYLGDLDFFDDELGPIFPSLDFMECEMPNLPPEGFVIYVEDYILDIFGHQKNWVSPQEKKTAKRTVSKYYPSIFYKMPPPQELYNFIVDIANRCYTELTPQLIIGFIYDPMTMSLCESQDYEFESLNSVKISQHELVLIDIWQDLDREFRENIVKSYFEYKEIKIGDKFVEDWNIFFTKRPELAKIIWTFMDREELLNITNVPIKRRGTSLKSDYQQMREYLQRIGPRTQNIDQKEVKLRKELDTAKRGCTPFGCTNAVVNEKEVRKAEDRLKKYVNQIKNKPIENGVTVMPNCYQYSKNAKMFTLSGKR